MSGPCFSIANVMAMLIYGNESTICWRPILAPGSFLEGPAVSLPPTIHAPMSDGERPGAIIGPYRLMEQIGEGGMGLVYLAEQQQPLRRKVALEIIKPGMDSSEVIARFEAERQALALMEHAIGCRRTPANASGG